MEQVERSHMESVLVDCNENKSEAARRLGVSRKPLERKQHQWRQENIENGDCKAENPS
jgi:ActR/RegA family two-component response regulator